MYMHIYIYIYRPLACTGQWPNKPAEIASDEAAMRYRCSWKDLKDMALWTVLTHDACGMVYFVLTYTYALELIANVSRSSSRIRRRHERRQLNKILGMKSRLREWGGRGGKWTARSQFQRRGARLTVSGPKRHRKADAEADRRCMVAAVRSMVDSPVAVPVL